MKNTVNNLFSQRGRNRKSLNNVRKPKTPTKHFDIMGDVMNKTYTRDRYEVQEKQESGKWMTHAVRDSLKEAKQTVREWKKNPPFTVLMSHLLAKDGDIQFRIVHVVSQCEVVG